MSESDIILLTMLTVRDMSALWQVRVGVAAVRTLTAPLVAAACPEPGGGM